MLRSLLLSGTPADGEIAALRIVGARVTGSLDLQYATVDHAVRLWACRFDRPPVLYGARFRQLNLSESVLPGLHAATVRVEGVLRLTGCRVTGEVRLGGATISGALFCDGARLGPDPAPGGAATAPGTAPGGPAADAVLQLNQATVEDDVWGPGLVADGGVRLYGAAIAGALNLEGAELTAPGGGSGGRPAGAPGGGPGGRSGDALNAETLTVGSNVRAAGLRARGQVELRGARIPGRLDLAGARLSAPGGTALHATSCDIGELWLRDGAAAEGTVNLRRSQIELIHLDPAATPDRLCLNDLGYGTLAPLLPAAERLPLLERDPAGYVPSAYEQLAAAYRRAGDDAAARTVRLARQRRYRATLPWYGRAWGHLQDVTVGYGYRPMRAAAWLAALLVAGTAAYALRHPAPLRPGEAPEFNALFYTLDLLLPIIDFGQQGAFGPRGWHQWLSYVLILAGWVLATTIAAGVSRALNRS